MKWKISTVIFGLLAVVAVWWGRHQRWQRLDAPSIIAEIKPLNQLATVRYSIQRVIGVREPKEPFGEESLLLMVQGDVIAGVDLADLSAEDVRYLNDHTVAIHLPQAQVLQAFVDEKNTKVWDRHITWWTPWVPYDPDLEHKARLSAIDEIRAAAISMGILSQANSNAQTAIKGLLSSLGLRANFNGQT